MGVRRQAIWIGLALFAAGVGLLILGIVNRSWSRGALLLVGFGGVLVLVGGVLPWLESLKLKLPGVDLSVVLIPPDRSADDRDLLSRDKYISALEMRRADAYTSLAPAFEAVFAGGSVDYLIINLEAGRSWLSSRLYLFINALAEVRGIEAIVFTSRIGSKDTFVGVCSVNVVSARLAWAFPWLPRALADAWSATRGQYSPPRRRMASRDASKLYTEYVRRLLTSWPEYPGPTPPSAEEWEDVGEGGTELWEHAKWVDQAFIEDLLKGDITNDCVVGLSDQEQTIRAALAKSTGRYIAVLDDFHQFRSLLDRARLLPQLAAVAAKSSP